MIIDRILDVLGDGPTDVVGGLLVGALFGVFAQRSRFCLRAAVLEFSRGSIGPKVAVWLLAFGVAVLGTQGLADLGLVQVAEAKQLAARNSLSGALVGGMMFGIGMILTRGCSARLLVLAANGNLRALLSGLVFAVAAQSSLRGALAPIRDALAAGWTIAPPHAMDLLSAAGLGRHAGPALGALFLVVAIGAARRNRIGWGTAIAAAGVGAMIAAGWLFTYTLSSRSFGVVPLQSLNFTGPSADELMLILGPLHQGPSFGLGVIPGVFLGSFFAAAWRRELKIEGFRDGASMARYIAGAMLMGFGGMLAGGCAVGAGLSGGSIFAITAWVTLTGMWAGAGAAAFLIDREDRGLPARTQTAP